MNKSTIAVIALIVALFGGAIIYSSIKTSDSGKVNINDYNASAIQEANDDNGNIADHVRGKADSKVIFVEYADLQCPGCATAMPNINKIYEEYGDRVAFVFRNFPIQGHQNARAASAAAESAGFQNYYWEMITALYSNRSNWIEASGNNRTDAFVEIFKKVAPEGDVNKFKEDISNTNITKKIDFDYNLGKNVHKVTATPAFYVNGEAVDVSASKTQDDLKKNITDLIDKKLKEDGE